MSKSETDAVNTVKNHLVGGIPTPLKHMKVNWDDEIPNIWENKSHVPNHQLFKVLVCFPKRCNRRISCFSTLVLARSGASENHTSLDFTPSPSPMIFPCFILKSQTNPTSYFSHLRKPSKSPKKTSRIQAFFPI